MKDETLIVTAGRDPESNHGIVNPPVYHASTILSPSLAALDETRENYKHGIKQMSYGRRSTPTSAALETAVAALEGGHDCQLYPSGLAAIAAAMLAYLEAGDNVLMVDSVYSPTRKLCDSLLKRFGVTTTFYDPLIGAGIAELMTGKTRIVFCESPGSITFEVQDIPALAEAAHANAKHPRGVVVMMDNTWASPLFFKPFRHGVDVSIQAATKYIVGHSDVMMGTATANEAHWRDLAETCWEMGQCAGPDDIYLAQRGLRTLDVRLRRHMENGIRLAEWLGARPEVDRVLHPALPGDPGHALWKRDFLGASGLFSVVLKPCRQEQLAALVDDLELFGMGASWGGYESLILPQRFSRTATKWTDEGPVVRFHAGLEAVEDLTADLEAGFRRMAAA